MASKKVYLDLDGQKLNILKDWRTNPLSTPDRIALGATLNSLNIGLPVYDITQQILYMWNGSIWVVSGGAPIPPTWGAITGNINDQTDLQAEFALKANISSLAIVAFSGNYNDLINLPVIPPGQIQSDYTQTNTIALDYIKNKPTALSQFTNDVGFITASSTNTLTNKSGNISQWTNDSGYLTSNQIITLTGNVTGSGSTSIVTSILDTVVTAKLLTGYISGAGTISATDSILSAIQKLNGNIAAIPTVTPASPTTSVQFNNSGVFGGSSNFVWTGTAVNVFTNKGILDAIGVASNNFRRSVDATVFVWGSAVTGITPSFNFQYQNAAASVSTSGTQDFILINPIFNPVTGTGIWNALNVSPSVNQTGGANGVIRGIYINPNISAAVDFRSFEINRNGFGAIPSVGSGVFIRNLTAATAVLNQSSPALTLEGQGWKTTATAGSQSASIQMYSIPTTNTTSPTCALQMNSVVNSTSVGMMNISLDLSTNTLLTTPRQFQISNNAGAHFIATTSNRSQLPQQSIQVGGQLHVGGLSDAVGSYFQIASGTTVLSQINLPAGVAKTTPVAGDIWFDGTHYYGTIGTTPIQLDNSLPIISNSFSQVGAATTVFTVSIGSTLASNVYRVAVTPTSLLSAAIFYVTNKTTTTFDVTYTAGLTGTVTFDWEVFR